MQKFWWWNRGRGRLLKRRYSCDNLTTYHFCQWSHSDWTQTFQLKQQRAWLLPCAWRAVLQQHLGPYHLAAREHRWAMPTTHHRPPQTVTERVVTPPWRTAGNGLQVKEIPPCPGKVRRGIWRHIILACSVQSIELDFLPSAWEQKPLVHTVHSFSITIATTSITSPIVVPSPLTISHTLTKNWCP